MVIFKNPQDPFIDTEFSRILMDYVKIVNINNCPTFNGKTFFWSTDFYPGIERQYFLNKDAKGGDKLFFLKLPSSYRESYSRYSKSFRNAVNKSRRCGLSVSIISNPAKDIVDVCYGIYKRNMDRLRSFSFSLDFFGKLCSLPYSDLWVVEKDGIVMSFALMFGNLMFIQSSDPAGKASCANNYLYDTILKKLENNYIYFGIASKNNAGLFKFKMDAGLDAWSANETKFDIFQHGPAFLRGSFLAWKFIKIIDEDRLIKYCLPY